MNTGCKKLMFVYFKSKEVKGKMRTKYQILVKGKGFPYNVGISFR